MSEYFLFHKAHWATVRGVRVLNVTPEKFDGDSAREDDVQRAADFARDGFDQHVIGPLHVVYNESSEREEAAVDLTLSPSNPAAPIPDGFFDKLRASMEVSENV